MPEKWTGDISAIMHIHRITGMQLAKELGYTKEYVSMVLNGKRSPAGAEQKFREAINRILQEKGQG